MSWRGVTVSGYLVVLLAAIALELVARRRDSRIPSIGTLLSRLMRTRAGRLAVLAGWVWLGMHFFAA